MQPSDMILAAAGDYMAHLMQMGKENCPKYYETHTEIHNLMKAYIEAASEIFRPVTGR